MSKALLSALLVSFSASAVAGDTPAKSERAPEEQPASKGVPLIRPEQVKVFAERKASFFAFDASEEQLTASWSMVGSDVQGSISVRDCGELYRKIRAAAPPTVIGSPDFPVELRFGLVSRRGKPILDHAKKWCEYARDNPPSDVNRSDKLLSLVGPALTIRSLQNESIGGGPPYHYENWLVFDVRTGGPLELVEMVDAKSLEAALRNDKVVQEAYSGAVPASATIDGMLSELHTSGYAFYEYDAARDRVAVRISFLRESCGMCPNNLSQLGVWVKPTEKMRKYFVDAAGGKGFYMSSKGSPLSL